MQVLVTGGTGVIGLGAIPELLAAGHRVRLLSRSAADQADEWPEGVECVNGDVTDVASMDGAAEGCDAVIHITGIVDEKPPEITFERINFEGTRNVLAEAERAGVQRFLFVSSLGADRGQSSYHESKRKAEELVRGYSREWIITRPGHVFGPGDEMISTLLKMVRASLVVPEVGFGQHRFQPLWYKDFGKALNQSISESKHAGQVFDMAGAEVITVSELLRTLSDLTDRPAFPIPLPGVLVRTAVWVFARARRFVPWGGQLPLNESKLTMLVEENVIAEGRTNALTETLGITPTPLGESLRELTQCLPENPLDTGVGALERKRFWADIAGASVDAEGLMHLFKTRVGEVMPIDFSAEPGAPREVEDGATLSASLPGRGHIQVRVQKCEPGRVCFSTIEGHPLAGVVSFYAEHRGPLLRFTVETLARPANTFDWVAINCGGRWFQDLTWQNVVSNMTKLSGGKADDGVQHHAETLADDEAKKAEEWASDLIARRKRQRMEAEVATKS